MRRTVLYLLRPSAAWPSQASWIAARVRSGRVRQSNWRPHTMSWPLTTATKPLERCALLGAHTVTRDNLVTCHHPCRASSARRYVVGSRPTRGEAARPLCPGTSIAQNQRIPTSRPRRPKTHTHVTHTEQEGNRKGAKPSMPRQGSFHSLPHTQIHSTYYYRFESCGGPRSLFLYICLLQLLFSITAGPI